MGTVKKMENRIEALEAKLTKVADEVQKIPILEKKVTALLEEMDQLLAQQEVTKALVRKMQEEKERQKSSEPNSKRLGEELQQRLPEGVLRRMRELPLFNGSDSSGWILRMEHYFDFNPVDDVAMMMETIERCMSGQPLAWFRLVQRWRNPPRSWDEFRQALFVRFEGGNTMYDRFFSLQQDGSVEDYCSRFETVGALLPGIPDCLLEAKFMNGLKAEIRKEVRVLRPKGILDIMERARLVGDKNHVVLNSALGDE